MSEKKKPRRGRPKTRPAGAKFRGIWLTDAEWKAVRAVVKKIRDEV